MTNEIRPGDSTLLKVQQAIVDVLELDSLDDVASEILITDIPGADSLDMMEVIMLLEDELDLEIPDDSITECRTIGGFAAYLDGLLA